MVLFYVIMVLLFYVIMVLFWKHYNSEATTFWSITNLSKCMRFRSYGRPFVMLYTHSHTKFEKASLIWHCMWRWILILINDYRDVSLVECRDVCSSCRDPFCFNRRIWNTVDMTFLAFVTCNKHENMPCCKANRHSYGLLCRNRVLRICSLVNGCKGDSNLASLIWDSCVLQHFFWWQDLSKRKLGMTHELRGWV